MGYRYVIAIGNDTPRLQARHLLKAASQLTRGRSDMVIGPASDGGTWLMGYARDAFDPSSFCDLPWQTPNLLDAVMAARDDRYSIALLETFGDIDDAHSLQLFLRTNRIFDDLTQLVNRLCSLLGSLVKPAEVNAALNTTNYHLPSISLRAPPLSAA